MTYTKSCIFGRNTEHKIVCACVCVCVCVCLCARMPGNSYLYHNTCNVNNFKVGKNSEIKITNDLQQILNF